MRQLPVCIVALLFGVGCGSKDKQRAPSKHEPPRIPVSATFGAGPSPAYPRRVPLDSDVRPARLLAVPGGDLAALAGADLDGPVLQLIDLGRGAVVWTDHKWCMGRLVHASRERLICASARGVRALKVSDGTLAWTSPQKFRAAVDDRVLAGDVLLDMGSGHVAGNVVAEAAVLQNVRRMCPSGGAYAWTQTGTFWSLSPDFSERWSVRLGRAPTQVDVCGDPLLVQVGDSLRALDAQTGALLGEAPDVTGWWPSPGSGGVTIADGRGVHRRTRRLDGAEPVVSVPLAGRLLAERDELRVVRALAGGVLLIDRDGLRRWLAAPAGASYVVVTKTRLLATAGSTSPAATATLYELPTAGARVAWPTAPLGWRPRAHVADVDATPLPELSADEPTEIAFGKRGAQGVSAVALSGERVYVAVHERRPGPGVGAGVAAFDLRERAWKWYQVEACARDARVMGLAATGGVVACATRENDPGQGAVVGIDAASGAVKWQRAVRTVDRIAGGGGRFVVVSAAHAYVLDASTGEVVRDLVSGRGLRPLVAATESGVVHVDVDGTIAGPSWRVGVDGLVTGLSPVDGAVLVNLAGGALFTVDAATGAPSEVAGWSASADVPVSGDLFFDRPEAAQTLEVLRAYRGGAEAFRFVYARITDIASARAGALAPLVLVDHWRAARVMLVDPRSGHVDAVHPWPRRGFRRGAFSAVVDGVPVAGVMLAKPLAVQLFPQPR